MEILYLLIPISMLLLGLIFWLFSWAVRNGQFDDLEAPAQRILMDCDRIVTPSQEVTEAKIPITPGCKKTSKN